jgi:hypothetical protein
LLIRLNNEELQLQAFKNKTLVKLVDSFQYEAFDPDHFSKFEPLRSRERQELIHNYLKQVVPLDYLKANGVIDSLLYLPSLNLIYKISLQWLRRPRWYFP